LRCELVAGRSDAHGLAGIYDPAGLDKGWAEPLLQAVLAEGAEWLRIGVGEGEAGAVLLEGELFNTESVVKDDLAVMFEQEGVEMLKRLRGAFALVAWDARRARGLIAVDQVGGRSMYLAPNGTRLLFASDICLLLRLLPRRPDPNHTALVHWLSNSSPAPEVTFYDGVLRLPAGECVELTGGWATRSYWSPHYEPPRQKTRDEAAAELWETLLHAVSLRTGDDSAIGIIMSGGVDSSAVAAAATEVAGAGAALPRGYSAVFPGHPHPRVDESDRIQELVDALGLPSLQVHIEPGGAFALSLEFLEAWEIPLLGPGYLLERPLLDLAAANGVDALLDGQGGDELFGLSGFLLADRLRQGRIVSSLRLARSYPGIRQQPRKVLAAAWRHFAVHGAVPHAVHRAARRARPARYVPDYLTPSAAQLYLQTEDQWEWKKQRGVPRWWAYKSHAITRERSRSGIGEYLRQRAELSGMKARPPLLDVDLIELALQIPPELEYDPNIDRPLIREALRGRVPESVRLATLKSNLAPFYFDGIAGPDLKPIRTILRARDAEILAYVEPDVVRRMVDEPPAARGHNWLGWMSTVWSFVSAECWLRHQADRGFAERVRERGLPQPKWTARTAEPQPAGTQRSSRRDR
jgi:asparagine synthase (glutamine-hydrolysing)